MKTFDYVIVGGGLAGVSAVDGIREMDPDGLIAMFADEPDPPYHRPPLSKEFLLAEGAPRELLHVKPQRWFEEQTGLALFKNNPVTRLDARALTVHPTDGGPVRGQRILIATGGRPRRLEIPGSGLDGVAMLRTAGDSEQLREAARDAKRVVLVGAGFIGMELASTLSKIDTRVTVVELEPQVWRRVFPEAVSGFLRRYFEQRGVGFHLGRGVAAFAGEDRLSGVVLDGGEEIAADLAIVGVGMTPNDGLGAEAGLAVRDGIIVDGFGETTAAHIYAAGDVARFPDPVRGGLARVEHWDHARAQGRHVGRNMAGARDPFDHLSYFFTNVFDLSINVFGETAAAERTIISGEMGSGRSIIYCVAEDRLAGTVLINATGAMEACRTLVRARPSVEDLLKELEETDAPVQTTDAVAGDPGSRREAEPGGKRSKERIEK